MNSIGIEPHSVVVGVDGSASALGAVRWAAHEASRREVPLRLVHVCHLAPVRHPRQVTPPPAYHEAVFAQGRHWLNQAAEVARTTSPGVTLTTDLRDGVTAEVLVGESNTARLVVLGSRGLGGFTGLLLGSVAVAVSAHAHCPVVVLRPSVQDSSVTALGPVVVGVDGSSLSDAAVRFAFETAAASGARLVALHTWFDAGIPGIWAPVTIDRKWIEGEESTLLDKALAGWVEKFPDVVVQKIVEREHPAHALLRHAAGAQLVVVGSRGRGALTGLGLGSVSQALLHHADRPVAVVRNETSG